MTVGYNASVGIDNVIEFQGFWLSYEISHA
jgi:hypothetical protein